MIDIDKMKMAFAATPLCQRAWVLPQDGQPSALCALSALAVFAGRTTPQEIRARHHSLVLWISAIAEEEYGIPRAVSALIPAVFDTAPTTEQGVASVLRVCELHNAGVPTVEIAAEAMMMVTLQADTVAGDYSPTATVKHNTFSMKSIGVGAYYPVGTIDIEWTPTVKTTAPKANALLGLAGK